MTEPDYEPTRLIRKSSSSQGGNPSQAGGEDEDATRIMRETDDDTTRLVHQDDSPGSPADAEVTKLVRPSSASRGGESAGEAREDSSGPVVGWLVVVTGPGKGRSLELGYGMNTIGRGDKNRVRLAFGDQEISRDKHATVTYDPRGGKFFLQHGDSTNLTYLEDSPVLSPTEISNGQTIRIGDSTVVKFVALCGPDFHWED